MNHIAAALVFWFAIMVGTKATLKSPALAWAIVTWGVLLTYAMLKTRK